MESKAIETKSDTRVNSSMCRLSGLTALQVLGVEQLKSFGT